jgi:hypothetical protein
MYRTVEDFDDWTSWLLYKGGVGVKGENSWESWWDEEQVCNQYKYFLAFFLTIAIETKSVPLHLLMIRQNDYCFNYFSFNK